MAVHLFMTGELENLKKDGAEWCSQVELCISKLTNDRGISIWNTQLIEVKQFQLPWINIAIQWLHYILMVISNIKSRFSGNSLKLVVSVSCFDPSLFPSDDSSLSDYGNDQLKTLVEFYRF